MHPKVKDMIRDIACRRARMIQYIESLDERSSEVRANKRIYLTMIVMVALVFLICLLCCLFALKSGGNTILP